MSDSRISGFYKLGVRQRIDALEALGWLSPADADALRNGRHVLAVSIADRMIENVVGVFGLPFAVSPNFRVNGKDYVVPMVVEEPSIVAALSFSASLALRCGGFEAHCKESLLAGQVHVTAFDTGAVAALQEARDELLSLANAVHPRLTKRGGGVRELQVRELSLPGDDPLLVVELLVDTCDAMGANLVNTICESIAPRIADASGGDVALRILSNLCDRSLVTAKVRYGRQSLSIKGMEGDAVRDAVIRANDIALSDAHRAATHNKGILNGIDPLAIATGNDWRAIEAGAHAWAANSGRYLPLTRWFEEDGDLVGELTLPLKVGTVGGTLNANRSAALGLALTGVQSARELAGLMAAVGLAQNFAALRALVTGGIQVGHMRLHARSVAATAGAPDDLFDEVVDKLVSSGEVKLWKAREILQECNRGSTSRPHGEAAGKVILLGEHAVVYGKHALALPVQDAISARIEKTDSGVTLSIPEWQFGRSIDADSDDGVDAAVTTVIRELGIAPDGYAIFMNSALPHGMGLGSSAAFAVALVRAFDRFFRLGLDDQRVNTIAFECEKIAHGEPSGVDNTLATFGVPMLFRNDGSLTIRDLELETSPSLVVAWGANSGNTREEVAGVRVRRDAEPEHFDAMFEQIDDIVVKGAAALEAGDLGKLGALMNINHGILNAIGVSTPELELMVGIARQNGALGAKLTGAGGGGSIVALCAGSAEAVATALENAGFRAITLAGKQDTPS